MDKLSFKENIKKYYNQEAELRNSKTVKEDWKIKVREDFFKLIKQENKETLLELGAGAGYDSQFFMNKGLAVTAIDLSDEMVKRCKEKAIEAYEMDFYNLSPLNKKYDSIYAINTLLHVPKSDLLHVLIEINSVLRRNGLFFLGLYGGEDTENESIKSEVSDVPRFFAFHSENYLKTTLGKVFEILQFDSFDIGSDSDIFHSIIMRKKSDNNPVL
jgi:SAM-dependent methyltransferase